MPDANAALWLLIAVVVINTIVRIRAQASERAVARNVAVVLDALLVWADTWGQPPDDVKAELQKKLYGRRKTDPPRTVAGAAHGA